MIRAGCWRLARHVRVLRGRRGGARLARGRRRVIWRRETVLNGPRKRDKDRSAPFERSIVTKFLLLAPFSIDRVDPRAFRSVSRRLLRLNWSQLSCLRTAPFSETMLVDERHNHGGS